MAPAHAGRDPDDDDDDEAMTDAAPAADADADADADAITASYRVFLNPALPPGRRLLVLQHPNRTDDAPRPAPTELRLKALSGMVEVDVPLDTGAAYDRDKGLAWGRALHASMAAKNGGSHGLAGGFGLGAVPQRPAPRKRAAEGGAGADDVVDWNDAVRQDKVLRTQTLGGQYPDSPEVQYMVGVFHGNDLHLTPVSSLVHLRPQLHHLDATTQQERSAASAASKDAAPSSASAARAIHMTIKTTADGDAVATETMADRLRFVQTEPWRKMPYTDENDQAAWDVYNDSLFIRPPPAAAAADTDTPSAAEPDAADLEAAVPRFAAKWGDKQLLESVSGITKPDAPPEPEVKPHQPPDKLPEPAPTPAGEATRPKGRTRGGAAAAPPPTARRGGRAKAASSRAGPATNTVNVD